MARNDRVLVDGILDERVATKLPSGERDEAFEYFVIEQILRDAELSKEDIESGWIDGRDDGGIDALFVLVNGLAVTDPDSFIWPKTGCELDLWIITCKHRDAFRQAPLDNLAATVGELLDFGIAPENLKGPYSEEVLRRRHCLVAAYRRISTRLTRSTVHFVYASRGDSTEVGASVRARSEQVKEIARELFGNAEIEFAFVGAGELMEMYRQVRNVPLELRFVEALTRGGQYLLLCELKELLPLVADEQLKLRRYLFDSNVRAYMGLNRVNEEILATLHDESSPDFWWLNNGITILVNRASVTGKLIQMEGVQIVNGLQTTESISRYFNSGGNDSENRCVLIKIVVSSDAQVRDAIIRATNNQTAVELASLHATDKVQRDIEAILLRDGLFYERRKNFYQGHPPAQVVSPLYLAAGYVNLVLKVPSSAASLKSKFMREEGSYRRVFDEDAPLRVWPKIARVLKRVDEYLESVRPTGLPGSERFLRNWRQVVALLATARVFGSFAFTAAELAELDISALDDALFSGVWAGVRKGIGPNLARLHSRRSGFVVLVCREFADAHGLKASDVVESKDLRGNPNPQKIPIGMLGTVRLALPGKPWSKQTDRDVATRLGISRVLVTAVRMQLEHEEQIKREGDEPSNAPNV